MIIQMYSELERIAEIYGVKHQEIPAFLTDIEALIDRLIAQRRYADEDLEPWHGKVPSRLA